MKTINGTGAMVPDYESDWKQYVFPDSESEFASTARIRSTFRRLDLEHAEGQNGGIPLACDGKTAWVNDSVEHTVIFGESGSGKSFSLIMPLLPILANNQSIVAMDIKGELSSNVRIRSYLESVGCKCVYLDFRNFDKDSYNLLQYPFELYRSGNKDKAMATVTSFIRTLSEPFTNSRADPYWHLTSEEFLLPVIQILFEVCSSKPEYYKYVNMLTLASFCNESGTDTLKTILRRFMKTPNNATEMLRGVLAAPDKTLSCIVSTVSSFLRDFIIQDSLLKMLSSSTFDVRKMYTEKMCVFLILPDETNAYNSISALLVDYFYNQLIDEYSAKYQHSDPPHGIAWVMDEFCNMHINDMGSKISASRGRMMRWFLVCQSKAQLDSVYEEAAPTIIGNCKNILFLQSSDPDMLGYISNMLGTTNITHSGHPEPLMSAEKLKSLPRTPLYRQGIFIRDDLKYKVNLPGFNRYSYLDRYNSAPMDIPTVKKAPIHAYTPSMLYDDLNEGRVPVPFAPGEEPPKPSRARRKKPAEFDLEAELAKKFDELFGTDDDD